MKFLHCADLHLDSPLTKQNGALRRKELLSTFKNAVDYAVNGSFDGVLIAGDMFDNDYVSQDTFNGVVSILSQPINFYIVCGNHSSKSIYKKLASKTGKNVHFFFDGTFCASTLGQVCIWGAELDGNDFDKWQNFTTDPNFYNIVLLHCDDKNPSYGLFDKAKIQQNKVDYVALGHIHAHACYNLGKTKVCYSGALEPRGFDEKQKCGFVVLDTDKSTITFVHFAKRNVETVTVDVDAVNSTIDLEKVVEKAVAKIDAKDYLNLVLTGELEPTVDVDQLYHTLENRFFSLRIENTTSVKIDVKEIEQENSIKGVFVSLVKDLEDANEILKLGIKALDGEKLC